MLLTFIARRIVISLLLLLLMSFIIFALTYLAPGSPERLLLGHRPADPAVVKEIRTTYHLDDSLITQYGYWLGDAIRLKFGRSIVSSQTVSSLISARLGVS